MARASVHMLESRPGFVGAVWENKRSRQERELPTASDPHFRTYRKGAGVKPTRHHTNRHHFGSI
jgi:hypothetical protein